MGRAARIAAAVAAGGVLAVVCGCTTKRDGEDAFRLRNLAVLEAARDTAEGYLQASRYLRRLVESEPTREDVLNLARVYLLAESWPEADFDRFQSALELLALWRERWSKGGAVPPDVPYLEGLAYKHAGKPAEASERFRQAAALDPTSVEARYQLAVSLLAAKKLEDARRALLEVLELDPRHRAATYRLGTVERLLGRAEEAERWLRKFAQLEREGAASVPERRYERCRFTEIDLVPPGRGPVEPPQPEIRFERMKARGLEGVEGVADVAAYDADGDGRLDLYLACRGRNRLFLRGEGGYRDVSELSSADAEGPFAAVAAADFDNDSIADLALAPAGGGIRVFRGVGEAMYQELEPVPAPAPPAALLWIDYDHDGDLDLAGLGGKEAVVFRNNGALALERMEDVFPGSLHESARGPGALRAGDFDRGNDIDFAVADPGGPVVCFLNLRRGPFRRQAIEGLEGHPALAVFDLDADGDFDIVAAPGPAAPLRIARNRTEVKGTGAARFEVVPVDADLPSGAASDLTWGDADNDGDQDVFLAAAGAVYVLRNVRGGRLETAASVTVEGGVRRVRARDLDGDGLLDLAVVDGAGRLHLFRNRADPRYGRLLLALQGSRDNRDGIGAHVELFADEIYERILVCGRGGARLGLGPLEPAALDGISILWPNGIRQPLFRADLEKAQDGRLEVVQKQGLVVSCPFLYTWDGGRYRFLTDIVGIAPLDEWLPPGTKPHLDPEEFVRIPGDRLSSAGGVLRLVVTEELREVTYLDRLELYAVRHPRSLSVYGDESTRQGAYDPLRVYVVEEGALERPAGVYARGGAAERDLVLDLDGRYLHGYEDGPPQWSGWVEPWSIELEFPGLQAAREPALLLTGRIAWQDSGVSYSIAQHGRRWEPHRLEAVRRDGTARVLVPDTGFPCGMDRTVVVPLPELGPGERRLRLRATHRLLWDRIALAREAAEVVLPLEGGTDVEIAGRTYRLHVKKLPLLRADLRWHGFSARRGDFARHEHVYEFERADAWRDFDLPRGRATRYGDVRPLLLEHDDRLVVIPPGDAVFLEFAPGEAPGPRESVTYFLRTSGWAKESGFHNRTGRTIEPLPFRAMETYPDGARAPPDSEEYRRYLATYQTREIGSW